MACQAIYISFVVNAECSLSRLKSIDAAFICFIHDTIDAGGNKYDSCGRQEIGRWR